MNVILGKHRLENTRLKAPPEVCAERQGFNIQFGVVIPHFWFSEEIRCPQPCQMDLKSLQSAFPQAGDNYPSSIGFMHFVFFILTQHIECANRPHAFPVIYGHIKPTNPEICLTIRHRVLRLLHSLWINLTPKTRRSGFIRRNRSALSNVVNGSAPNPDLQTSHPDNAPDFRLRRCESYIRTK